MRRILIVALIMLLLLPTGATAQTGSQVFTWRVAGMTLEYPEDWSVGVYEGNPVLASSDRALARALEGRVPGEPALTLLHYPHTASMTPEQMLNTVFPGIEPQPYTMGTTGAVMAEFGLDTHFDLAVIQRFVDAFINGVTETVGGIPSTAPTGLPVSSIQQTQAALAIAFESPATRDTQIMLAVAPQPDWEAFRPTLQSILDSVQFLTSTAELTVFDATVIFEYLPSWDLQRAGQLMVASQDAPTATAVLNGDLEEDAAPFVRSQLVIPSGIGIDPGSPTVADEVLLRFLGMPPEDVDVLQTFAWAEDMPAASAWFRFEGLRLLIISVVNDDVALIIGGGATEDAWATNQAAILGALNLTRFGDTLPPEDLTAIVTGQPISVGADVE